MAAPNYGLTPTQLFRRNAEMYEKWEKVDSIWPDLTKENKKNYFDHEKPYEPISSYDCMFNTPEGWDQKSARSDRKKREGDSHDRIYQEEKHKIVPVLTSFWYGRPNLPFVDMLTKGFARKEQGRIVIRRNGVNLNAENELQPTA